MTNNVVPSKPDQGLEGPDYLKVDEVVLLLHAGFKAGLSDTSFWRKGNDGQMYTAALLPGRGNLAWYIQRERGGLSNYKDSADEPYMTREEFIHNFR